MELFLAFVTLLYVISLFGPRHTRREWWDNKDDKKD